MHHNQAFVSVLVVMRLYVNVGVIWPSVRSSITHMLVQWILKIMFTLKDFHNFRAWYFKCIEKVKKNNSQPSKTTDNKSSQLLSRSPTEQVRYSVGGLFTRLAIHQVGYSPGWLFTRLAIQQVRMAIQQVGAPIQQVRMAIQQVGAATHTVVQSMWSVCVTCLGGAVAAAPSPLSSGVRCSRRASAVFVSQKRRSSS